jgi:serine phosphatase RsbU (regulator of sigma subunit)
METLKLPLVEYGLAKLALPGQAESGDLHIVCCSQHTVLIAVIDGIGHGEAAANAAKAAAGILRDGVSEPVISLVHECHEKLKATRGVVMSLASVDTRHHMMTWLGVGNVQGTLLRARAKPDAVHDVLLLRGGVVGSQLPALQAAVLPVCPGDTVVFVTDGIRSEYSERLSALEAPQRAADRILQRYRSGADDALVLVARLAGIRS